MKNVVYPYTCPYFLPYPDDDYRCSHMTYDCSYYDPEDVQMKCFLGRHICHIMIDLDNPKSPRTADEFFDGLHLDANEDEMKSIEIHIREFFERKLIEEKGGEE